MVLLIALGGTLILRNAANSSKSINDNYVRLQAELLAESAVEFAAMQMQGIDTTGGTCLNELNITVEDQSGTDMYDISARLRYSFVNSAANSANGCIRLTSDRNGTGDSMVLIDVVVLARDDANLSTEQIRVHKRSWQKM